MIKQIGVVVYAVAGVSHSSTEITPPVGCGSGQVLKWGGSSWTCTDFQEKLGVYDCGNKAITKIDFSTGTFTCDEFDLVYGGHSSEQCVAIGGEVVSNGINKFCRFNSASCNSGWIQFEDWSTTIAKYCIANFGGSSLGCNPCTTTFHNWGDTPIETCIFQNTIGQGCFSDTCYATRTKIGCY